MQEWPVYIEISTHSLTRRLTTSILENFISRDISTHSLTRRLTACWKRRRQWLCHFNSQPHKEADILWFWIPADTHYFNSQPHKEADNSLTDHLIRSPHFNSQPHKEADSFYTRLVLWYCYFNSQPHKEADINVWEKESKYISISTHSLTRRLTNVGYLSLPRLAFQLTASQGGWRPKKWKKPWRSYFNSQPHKEADHGSTDRSEPGLHFNSQPHKEADLLWMPSKMTRSHFNSQPHKEADI